MSSSHNERFGGRAGGGGVVARKRTRANKGGIGKVTICKYLLMINPNLGGLLTGSFCGGGTWNVSNYHLSKTR